VGHCINSKTVHTPLYPKTDDVLKQADIIQKSYSSFLLFLALAYSKVLDPRKKEFKIHVTVVTEHKRKRMHGRFKVLPYFYTVSRYALNIVGSK